MTSNLLNAIGDLCFTSAISFFAFYGFQAMGWDWLASVAVIVWALVTAVAATMIVVLPVVWIAKHVRITIV